MKGETTIFKRQDDERAVLLIFGAAIQSTGNKSERMKK